MPAVRGLVIACVVGALWGCGGSRTSVAMGFDAMVQGCETGRFLWQAGPTADGGSVFVAQCLARSPGETHL